MKKILLFSIVLLLLTGCATQVDPNLPKSIELVGFWHGLWHGMISPIAWIISLFNEDVAIYAIYNNGGWYDFGFMLGIGALGGGSKASSNRDG